MTKPITESEFRKIPSRKLVMLLAAFNWLKGYTLDEWAEEDIHIQGLTLKFQGFEWLLVMRAEIGGEAKVAFLTAGTALDCFIGFLYMKDENQLEWREDKYRQQGAKN